MSDREAFEHWYADHTGDAHIRKYCDSTGRYQFNAMQSSWEAWQAAQAQAGTKARRSAVNPEAGDYANCVDDIPQAQAGERKCSECGNGEPDLSLYCVRCLNNDHWHLIDHTQAGDGEAVAWMYEHDGMVHDKDHQPIFTTHRWDFVNEPYTETALYTRPQPAQQVNQQLLEEGRFKQGAEGFRKELLTATTPFLWPIIEGVFAVFAHAHGFDPESNVGDQVRAARAAIAAAQEHP